MMNDYIDAVLRKTAEHFGVNGLPVKREVVN
jgi:hypothetical protein